MLDGVTNSASEGNEERCAAGELRTLIEDDLFLMAILDWAENAFGPNDDGLVQLRWMIHSHTTDPEDGILRAAFTLARLAFHCGLDCRDGGEAGANAASPQKPTRRQSPFHDRWERWFFAQTVDVKTAVARRQPFYRGSVQHRFRCKWRL